MPSGACVIEYPGKRGVVWRIKYVDADGRQVKETLGKAADGWTRKKARSELRERLVAVERKGYRRPERATFATLARDWLASYPEAKGLKRSTRRGYEQIVENHLAPTFGTLQVRDVTVERIERYLAAKRRAGFSAASCNRQLNVLSLILRAALRRGLISSNAVALVDRPREQRSRWRIFSPSEVVAIEKALNQLVVEAETERDRDDRLATRVMFLTLIGTGIRRGEALGLHWRSVLLADPDGPVLQVHETWVRNADDTPKSAAGYRTIALGSQLSGELFEHRSRSKFSGDDERVFANPRTGRPFNMETFTETIATARLRAGIGEYVRPCHDIRHSSITNAAAAGTRPEPLMARAGHSSYSTTRRYIDLAGERFREEADRLEERLWGHSGTKNGYQNSDQLPAELVADASKPLG